MFRKIDEKINNFVEIFAMLLLILMTVIVTGVVISRYFFNRTPCWGEESALLCMVWFGFLSMALGVRDNRHIHLGIIEKILPTHILKVLDKIEKLLIFLFAVFMIVEGLKMSQVATKNYMPGLKINSGFLYAAVPFSGIAIMYYILTSFLHKKAEKEVEN